MKLQRFMNKLPIIFGLVSVLLMQGCVADDLSICGVNIRFTYTRHLDKNVKDKFSSDINKVNLYVFKLKENADPEGDEYYFWLEDSAEGKPSQVNYDRYLSLAPGYYKFVAWGNLGRSYSNPELIKDSTKIGSLAVSLIYPDSKLIENLPEAIYHGMYTDTVSHRDYVQIASADLNTNRTFIINLIKNTKHITVKAENLALGNDLSIEEALNLYECRISSTNTDHLFDNSISGDTRVHYVPSSDIDTANMLVSKFVIMRELFNDNASTLSFKGLESGSQTNATYSLHSLLTAYNSAIDKKTGQDILDLRDNYELILFFDETKGSFGVKIVDEWDEVTVPVNL